MKIFKSFCPGMGWDRGVCPGTLAPALAPGQRDTWTRIFFCPETKGQQDVPSRFVLGRPAGRPVPWKPYFTPYRCKFMYYFAHDCICPQKLEKFIPFPIWIFFQLLFNFFSNSFQFFFILFLFNRGHIFDFFQIFYSALFTIPSNSSTSPLTRP